VEIRALRDGDLDQAWALDRDSFHAPAERQQHFLRFAESARWIGAFDAGRLVAVTGAHGFGQFFGGRSVPMAGVHSVSVAPDRRGQGLARAVMTPLLHAMRERGERISSLFPATMRLYRGFGWELAGSYLWRGIAPRSLEALARPAQIHLRPGSAADLEALRACYARFAAPQNGQVDRSDAWWRRQAALYDERSVFVAEGPERAVEGYVVYRQLDGEWTPLGGPFRIAVYELVATTHAASLVLWRLLGSWAAQVTQIIYRGPAEDPLLLLLREQELSVLAEVRWMTRIVDAEGAVAARGFAPGLEIEVPFELRDPLLLANDGCFVLRVREGRGRLERGGRGGPALEIGAFSSLYTGWASTETLRRTGKLAGGSAGQAAALDAAFAGPTPWMVDEF
jgi:predicted acetyltransferase